MQSLLSSKFLTLTEETETKVNSHHTILKQRNAKIIAATMWIGWCTRIQNHNKNSLFIQIEEQNARDEEIRAATENLSEEKLQEFKDIFSFFDRF